MIYAAVLQQNYLFDSPLIMSNSINPECTKIFEVLQIPDGKTTYRMNGQILLKTFELAGCPIEANNVRFVNFTKRINTDLTILEDQVNTYFKANYPTISIQNIQIFPHGYIEQLKEPAKVIFEPDSYMRNKGVFYIQDHNGIRRYFDFSINATLGMLHTSKKVSRREPLSLNNIVMKTIPFNNFRGKPIIALSQNSQRFSITLKENTPILDRHLEPLPLVLKNNKVSVVVKNDSVTIEFIARATQEGALYDIITIEKSDGKRARAKIIGENQVELQ